ncbi:Delta(14)-sterol reductase [Cadophora malorum]|uniref:Delta(14)-sterol reductase n=1 Tax=Cadophora malorum TaxID=108018 RepID=A0A8H7WKB7_9HELO|nr:Delta(14)-sterol reductase [Cadophora malorum]
MAPKASKAIAVKHDEPHGYEFFGPPGAFAISFGLPLVVYAFTFLCNDISGCPVPSVLAPSTATIEQLKRDVGWPANGIYGLASWDATLKVIGYYSFSAILHRVLPGEEKLGVELASGGKLKYKFNTWSSTMVTFGILAAGTVYQGANFPVWTYIYDNFLQIATANILIAYFLATFVYVRSFSVKAGNSDLRELAAGGHSGNMLYDWFIGRELNPRVTLPLIGEIDIKEFMELRPGMMGWAILDFTFIARQYRSYGYVTDSILLVTAFQVLYILDSFWMENAILTTMDITTDGFGFMLSFGDLVWVPFVYSLQARYLATYPLSLGPLGTAGVLGVVSTGFYIFRSANNEKNRFRTDPNDPRVAHLKYIETKSGSRLLISGWWGMARHINYFGDWFQSWAYCLPTGVAGYLVQHSSTAPATGQSLANKSFVYSGPTEHTEVLQGSARGYGIIVTYFYVLYFAILLIHRERRDEAKCIRKYGDDWNKYREIVKYRIIPGIY